jgi:hypothetical protein
MTGMERGWDTMFLVGAEKLGGILAVRRDEKLISNERLCEVFEVPRKTRSVA